MGSMQHCMVANFDTSLTNAIITEKSAAAAADAAAS